MNVTNYVTTNRVIQYTQSYLATTTSTPLSYFNTALITCTEHAKNNSILFYRLSIESA